MKRVITNSWSILRILFRDMSRGDNFFIGKDMILKLKIFIILVFFVDWSQPSKYNVYFDSNFDVNYDVNNNNNVNNEKSREDNFF